MFPDIFCLQEVDWVYQQTRDSSKVLAVVGGLDLVKHDKMKEAIAKFSRSKGPRFVGVRYLLVWDEEDYLTREDVHQGEETFVCVIICLRSRPGTPKVVCQLVSP